jgi:hypothetical protein
MVLEVPVNEQYLMVGAHGRAKPLTSEAGSKERKELESHNLLQSTHPMPKDPLTSPHVLKVPPAPNSTTLWTSL